MGDYRVESVASHLFYARWSCSFNASCKTFERLMLCSSASFASHAGMESIFFTARVSRRYAFMSVEIYVVCPSSVEMSAILDGAGISWLFSERLTRYRPNLTGENGVSFRQV